MSNVVIKIVDMSKIYYLGSISGRTLSQDVSSWFARMRKKEDPNLKIDANSHSKNDKLLALDNINVEINEGDRVGILGSNGAGKSALLKILSRVTAPTSGNIYIKGRIASLLEVGTGFHPELSGRENIYLNGAVLGMTKKEIDEKLADIIEFAEIEKFIDTPVKRYSSGMYVRLAFAVAAHLEPEILIVDEVLAVGDYLFQQKCLGKMGDISKGGRTILFVSHQLSMIKALCNKCILLDHGKLIQYGETEDVIKEYISLRHTMDLTCHAEFEEDPQKEQAQVYKICIKNHDGKECSHYEIFEPIILEVEYEIKKSIIGASLGFSISKNQGTVCRSYDTDVNRYLMKKRETGRFITRVDIPPLLKAGNYVLNFTICYPGAGDIDLKKGVITFIIEEKTIDTSLCSYSAKRDGQIAAKQQWNYYKYTHKKKR